MNFKEYLNQENPKRYQTVIITKEDCEAISWALPPNESEISLTINRESYFYLLYEGWLWTQDGDGNRLKKSCFKFKSQ